MISELNENKLIRIRVILDSIVKEGFKILNENKNSFNIYIIFFKRYIYCFDTVLILLKNFDTKNIHRIHSLAIILRASLLDYLIVLYLYTFQLENKLNYNIELEKLHTEQIKRFLLDYKRTKNIRDEKEYRKVVDLIYLKFRNFFDKDLDYNNPEKSLKFNKQNDDLSIKKINKRLDNFSSNLNHIGYKQVLDLYELFSKFDHFGVVTMELYDSMEINDISEDIFIALFHIVDGITFTENLLVEEMRCKSNFKDIGKELSTLKGTIFTERLNLSKDYKNKHK